MEKDAESSKEAREEMARLRDEEDEIEPQELTAYREWIKWGEHPEHLPHKTESHKFVFYFNIIHAMRVKWEQEQMEAMEADANSGGSEGASPAGLESNPRSDPKLKDTRPGRSFPQLSQTPGIR